MANHHVPQHTSCAKIQPCVRGTQSFEDLVNTSDNNERKQWRKDSALVVESKDSVPKKMNGKELHACIWSLTAEMDEEEKEKFYEEAEKEGF